MNHSLHTYNEVLNLLEVISQSLTQTINKVSTIKIDTYTLLISDRRCILEHILKLIKKMYQDDNISVEQIVSSLGVVHTTANNYINNTLQLKNLNFKVGLGFTYSDFELFRNNSTGPYIYIKIEANNFYECFYEDFGSIDTDIFYNNVI